MEVNNKAQFSKFKKYIVVEPAYLESLKKSCNPTSLDESDVNLLKVLKNKNLNVNQKLNMYREILLSKKVPLPANSPVVNTPLRAYNEDNHDLATASSIGSDNVFDASFEQLIHKVDKLTPPKNPFEDINISVDMTNGERRLVAKNLAARNVKPEDSERYEPYTVPSKKLRSSWSKFEDIVANDEAAAFSNKNMSKQKGPKQIGKYDKRKK